jgi:GTP-binding protein HflX
VDDVLDQIGASEIPRLIVLNKIDLVAEDDRRRLGHRLPDAIQVSAASGEGLPELEEAIAERFAGRFEPVELLVPHTEGAVLSSLYALGAPISDREDTGDGVRIRARLPAAERARYARFEVEAGAGRTA